MTIKTSQWFSFIGGGLAGGAGAVMVENALDNESIFGPGPFVTILLSVIFLALGSYFSAKEKKQRRDQ